MYHDASVFLVHLKHFTSLSAFNSEPKEISEQVKEECIGIDISKRRTNTLL